LKEKYFFLNEIKYHCLHYFMKKEKNGFTNIMIVDYGMKYIKKF